MSNSQSTQKTLEQGRAAFAYECASEVAKIDSNGEYKSYTKKIPMLIKTNGLGAAFAFVKAKISAETDKPGYAYKMIYDHTTEWLKQEPKGLIKEKLDKNDDLIKVIVTLESNEYRALTNEVLAFMSWLKRFAEGLIDKEPEE